MTPEQRNTYAIEYLATQTDPVMVGCTAAMFADAKAAWLAALRTPNAPQTQRTLCDDDGFCCLGILALTLPGAEVLGDDEIGLGLDVVLTGDLARLEYPMFWSFDGPGSSFGHGDPRLGTHRASIWNDAHNKTFLEIADLVEQYVYAIPVPPETSP